MFQRLFPILKWLPNYKKCDFPKDLTAGITVGIILIPQGMAYALIAGLPPVYGLYAALFPQIVYAVMGTSRQLAVGPVAMDSLLVASGLGVLSLSSPEEYIAMAIALALFMGILQLVLGILRFGFVSSFLSKPVISGFTSAVALIIGFGQIKYLLGIQTPLSSKIHVIFTDILKSSSEINIHSLLIGICAIVLFVFIRKVSPKLPAAPIVVTAGITLISITNWETEGVAIVGMIPSGLPELGVPHLNIDQISELFPTAITLALIAFVEAISIAKAIGGKHKDYTIDANQELIALGSSNIVGAFFQSYPTTGGFSRTAVNDQAGAKTGISALISAIVVGLVLLFLTDLFYYLPKAVLAAVIIVAVFKLIDFKYPIRLFKTRKDEFFLFTITLLLTLFIGVKEGILFGVLCSLLLLVYRSSKPHYAILAKIKNTDYYKNITRFPDEIEPRNDLVILRFDAPLFFGNCDYFKSIVFKAVQAKEGSIKGFILNAESISYIDSSATEQLVSIVSQLKERKIHFMIAGAIGPARDILFNSKMIEHIKTNNLFVNIAEAVAQFDGVAEKNVIRKKVAEQSGSYKNHD